MSGASDDAKASGTSAPASKDAGAPGDEPGGARGAGAAKDDATRPPGGAAAGAGMSLKDAEGNVPPGTATSLQDAIESLRRKEKLRDTVATKEARDNATKEILETLGELETLTWYAESARALNVQIILRRRYEGAIRAAEQATDAASPITSSAATALKYAVAIACLGWFATIICVVSAAVLPRALAPTIRELWPALVATSGAVLLLVGIATLGYRFAQRTHERAVGHYDEAHRTRRLETAVRVLFANDKTTPATLEAVVLQLITEQKAEEVDAAAEISSIPESASKTIDKAVESLGGVLREVVARVKKD